MLKGKSINLRHLELSDIDTLKLGLNSVDIMEHSGRVNFYSNIDLDKWIRKSWDLRNKGVEYTFGIELNIKKLLIGYVKLKILNPMSKRGGLSIYIFSIGNRNKGYGTETMQLIINLAFKELNLHSLELNVFNTNELAINCYKKVGFKVVGKRRDSDYVSGKYITDIVMDLLKTEWTKSS